MMLSKLIFDGVRVKVRSKNVKFSYHYFGIKTYLAHSKFPHDSKYIITFLLLCQKLPKYASLEMALRFFLYNDMKMPKIETSFQIGYVECQHFILIRQNQIEKSDQSHFNFLRRYRIDADKASKKRLCGATV